MACELDFFDWDFGDDKEEVGGEAAAGRQCEYLEERIGELFEDDADS